MNFLQFKQSLFIFLFKKKYFVVEKIDALHSEITAFLRNLNLFIGDENLLISGTTVGLLEETILAIDRLVTSAEISSHSGNNGSDFVFQLDKDHFELRRHIMCRLCLVRNFNVRPLFAGIGVIGSLLF